MAPFLRQHLCADVALDFFAKLEFPKLGRLVDSASIGGVRLCADDAQFTCRGGIRAMATIASAVLRGMSDPSPFEPPGNAIPLVVRLEGEIACCGSRLGAGVGAYVWRNMNGR